MKIALCISGYYSNKLDINSGDKGYKYIKNNIIKNNDIDIFIHSWDIKNRNKINKNYSSAKIIYEDQINFHTLMNDKNTEAYEKFKNDPHYKKYFNVNTNFSFLYSRKKSLELAIDYARKNKFKYDCIIVCRFDLGFRCNYHLGYRPDILTFDKKLNMEYFYSSMWNQLNLGFSDHWFFSNQDNMEILSKIYDSYHNYVDLESKMMKSLKKWPDSNKENFKSNEILKKIKSNNLACEIEVNIFNSHFFHKFYFMESGLYTKSKFIKNGNCKDIAIVI